MMMRVKFHSMHHVSTKLTSNIGFVTFIQFCVVYATRLARKERTNIVHSSVRRAANEKYNGKRSIYFKNSRQKRFNSLLLNLDVLMLPYGNESSKRYGQVAQW